MAFFSDISLGLLFVLIAVAFLAGFIDLLSGGAGLLIVPSLLLVGLPVINAQACAKVSGFVSTLLAGLVLLRKRIIRWSEIKYSMIAAFVGGGVGTFLLQFVNNEALKIIVPIMLFFMGGYYLLVPNVGQKKREPVLSSKTYDHFVVSSVGFYDGFIGPGAGSFYALSNILCRGNKIVRATANAKLLNCASNAASLAIFIWSGKVVWVMALVMMVGQTLGAYVGSLVIIQNGKKVIRPLVVVACFSMLIYYVLS